MISVWNKIKLSKGFYINTYRRVLKWLMLSLGFNVVLIVGIVFSYLNLPRVHFYATNGAIALMAIKPVELQPLNAPNYSSQALLPPDPPNEGTGLNTINAF